MAENSNIAWTDHTFNGWIGCSKVHSGCTHCYAEEQQANRYKRVVWGPHGTRSLTSDANWNKPRKWNREANGSGQFECPKCGDVFTTATTATRCNCEECGVACVGVPKTRQRVFCGSLCDVFEDWSGPIVNSKGNTLCHAIMGDRWVEAVDKDSEAIDLSDVRRRLFGLIDETPNLDWLLLTKRPENIRRMWTIPINGKDPGGDEYLLRDNVWIGTSVSDQETADKAIPELLKCRDLAPVLFLSVEPLLGPVDLSDFLFERDADGNLTNDPRDGIWVIVGGESGPNARRCDIAWIADIVDQCAGVCPVFVKQLGSACCCDDNAGHGWPFGTMFRGGSQTPEHPPQAEFARPAWPQLTHAKGGDPYEWPVHLRVQDFPETDNEAAHTVS